MIAVMSEPRPGPGARGDYAFFSSTTTRWMDNDAFGHLNNAVYYSLIDSAVCARFVRLGILQRPDARHILMVAESGCRYHGEAKYPDVLDLGVRMARLGGSSVRHEIGVFRDGAAAACAEGFMVHVCVDTGTRRPAPMPADWRAALLD